MAPRKKAAKQTLPPPTRPMPGPSTAMDRWIADFPAVRIATLNSDGSLTGADAVSIKHLGGTVPNVGDVLGTVWGENDYNFQVVQRRYFLNEYKGDSYWLLVVRDAGAAPTFDAVSTNVLLVTDLERAFEDRKPEKETIARIAQINGRETPGIRRYKPKVREPDEPDDDTP